MLEWKDINVQDYVSIQYLNTITDIDREVVFTLYQPMIGAKATALYQFLVTQAKKRITHQSMLYMLQYNVQELFHARARLEAMGLVSTYRTDDENLDKYIYDVHAPITPFDFFNDPVYCGLLCEQIGEEHFNQLRARFMVTPLSLKAYTNVSQSFGKVFGQQINLHINDTQIIGKQKAKLAVEDKDFNWEFFAQLILGTYITEKQLNTSVKQAILTIHQLYHVSPMDMREYVLQAHSLSDNTINVDKLYALAREYKLTQQVTHGAPVVDENLSKQKVYPKEIQTLMQHCRQYAPAQFIWQIKQQKNAQQMNGLRFQVEKAELKTLELLVREFQFNEAIVNMMSYYVLMVLNHATLTEAYVKRVANDWVAKEITTLERAIDYLKQRVEPKEKSVKAKSNTRPATKQIKLTEREKQALQDVDIPVDDAEWQSIFS